MIGRSIAFKYAGLHKNTARLDEKCHSWLGFRDDSGGSSSEMKRFASVACGLVSTLVVTGCAGSLASPDDFVDGGTVLKNAETILAETCGTSTCHDQPLPPQHDLDLLSPNVESRVVGVNAIGLGCESRLLVVAGDPDASYLLDKVLNTPGICGLQMPVVGLLSQSEIDILRDWIDGLGGSGGGTLDGG